MTPRTPPRLTEERREHIDRAYNDPRLAEASSCAWCLVALYPPAETEPQHAVSCVAENFRALSAALAEAQQQHHFTTEVSLKTIAELHDMRNQLAEAERAREEAQRLRAALALMPQIDESLTNDTLHDDPQESEPCECEDCGRLRIDALKAVRAALRGEGGTE